ncbi:MAG TPA: hypothetical protein VNE21_07140 [Mycobacteriales bacterium]|nr:hypothetical protein [Mycobacteriales bacterium]
MAEGGEGEWRLVNHERIFDSLKGEDDESQRRVREALRRLLQNPRSPADIVTYPLRGRPARIYPDRRIAKLPDGWVLTYSMHPDGLPPLGGPIVMAHAFIRVLM